MREPLSPRRWAPPSLRIACIAAVLGFLPGAAPALVCTVTGADDAATFHLRCAGDTARIVRLAGLHAPRPGLPLEGGEAFGSEAREAAHRWLIGRQVELRRTTIALGRVDVRHTLLLHGLATWEGAAGEMHEPALAAAEREARLAARGVWSHLDWRRHRARVTVPLVIPTPPPEPSLGAKAERLARKPSQQRLAAFQTAIAEVPPAPPTAAPKPAPGGIAAGASARRKPATGSTAGSQRRSARSRRSTSDSGND